MSTGATLEEAFDWDYTQYPDGTRVYGETTSTQTRDWWKVELKGGIPYVFQTRLPKIYDTKLWLYDAEGIFLRSDDDGGDDGQTLSRIDYTPLSNGIFYIVAGGYSSYYGAYTLECLPVPGVPHIYARQPYLSDSRAVTKSIRQDKNSVLRNTVEAHQLDSMETRAVMSLRSGDQLSARQNIYIKEARQNSARQRMYGKHNVALEIMHPQSSANQKFHHAFTQSGWRIIATNIETEEVIDLGFAETGRLENVPLPDGTYEIEVRPSSLFWQDARSRKRWSLTILNGEIAIAGLPIIQNLRREISSTTFKPTLKWSISGDEFPDGMRFNVWFSESSPVDTTAPPTAVIPFYDGKNEYQFSYSQTANRYVAVAAIDENEVGQVAEIYLVWSGALPSSPPNQIAR